MAIEFEGTGRACVILLVGDDVRPTVYGAAHGVARTLEAWHYTNIIAVGCDLAIVDPTLLDEEAWDTLCDTYSSYVDVDFKMLLVKSSPHKPEMPRRNLVNAPAEITSEFLREQMIRAGRPSNARKAWHKKEPRMHRMMYMLYRLDTSVLRLRDVAERFDVSLRTVQRDFQILLAGDYPIVDGDEPGTYKLPKGCKTHDMYYP